MVLPSAGANVKNCSDIAFRKDACEMSRQSHLIIGPRGGDDVPQLLHRAGYRCRSVRLMRLPSVPSGVGSDDTFDEMTGTFASVHGSRQKSDSWTRAKPIE